METREFHVQFKESYPLQGYQPDEPMQSGVVPSGMTDQQAERVIPTPSCANSFADTPKESPSILAEADAIAGEDRSRDYGHPLVNHQRIADIWSVQIGQILKRPLEPREVALLMIGMKLAREVNSPKRDNLVDIAGYVKCIDMIDQAT